MNKDIVRDYLQRIGSKGGKVGGQVKCRGNTAYYAEIGRAGAERKRRATRYRCGHDGLGDTFVALDKDAEPLGLDCPKCRCTNVAVS